MDNNYWYITHLYTVIEWQGILNNVNRIIFNLIVILLSFISFSSTLIVTRNITLRKHIWWGAETRFCFFSFPLFVSFNWYWFVRSNSSLTRSGLSPPCWCHHVEFSNIFFGFLLALQEMVKNAIWTKVAFLDTNNCVIKTTLSLTIMQLVDLVSDVQYCAKVSSDVYQITCPLFSEFFFKISSALILKCGIFIKWPALVNRAHWKLYPWCFAGAMTCKQGCKCYCRFLSLKILKGQIPKRKLNVPTWHPSKQNTDTLNISSEKASLVHINRMCNVCTKTWVVFHVLL